MAKYFLYFCFFFALIFGAMIALHYTSWEAFRHVFGNTEGLILLMFVVVSTLISPLMGFVTREVRANVAEDRDTVLRVFEMCGYKLVGESHGEMFFRAAGKFLRLRLLYEDMISVTFDDKYLTMNGPRKEVVKIEFRLKTFLNNK
ncbi:MAG: hypothetical protein LBU80_00730 [Rikenellaceae bacterium]|nr:hypothetical protein [Rikenellaceae bacterium]